MIGKGWTPAAELRAGDNLLLQSGKSAIITGIECELLQKPIKVYNLEVENWHTYYVSRDGILVHNACWRGIEGAGDAAKGWKVGDDINTLTKAGKYPSWNTAKSRYWKNEAAASPSKYSEENLDRMVKGKAPLDEDFGVSKELHHINGRGGSNPHNINNLQEVWPWEHAEIDPYRYYNGSQP